MKRFRVVKTLTPEEENFKAGDYWCTYTKDGTSICGEKAEYLETTDIIRWSCLHHYGNNRKGAHNQVAAEAQLQVYQSQWTRSKR